MVVAVVVVVVVVVGSKGFAKEEGLKVVMRSADEYRESPSPVDVPNLPIRFRLVTSPGAAFMGQRSLTTPRAFSTNLPTVQLSSPTPTHPKK